jgi:predicted RNA polymerase sigma factor
MAKAVAIQEEIQARPQLARTWIVYAGLLARAGHVKRARDFVQRAIELCSGMAMLWDLDRATRMAAELERRAQP